MRTLRRALAVLAVLALASCTTPPYDGQRRLGGASPNPLGIIEGSILYVGPRPQCLRTADGTAAGITGNVILLMFDYDNPPPPTGSATTAANLFALDGSEMFNLADCMPVAPTAADLLPITRSANFTWPSILLASGPAAADGSYPTADYQIRGFFDDDGDFNPFFSIRNLATAGDVGGGAFLDAQAAIPVFRRLVFHHQNLEPEGELLQGVAVALGAVIDTERPMFIVDDTTQALSSEATIPLIADSVTEEQALWALASMHISLVSSNDQLDPDANMMTRPFGPALAAAGIQYDYSPLVHGMPVQPVDADGNGFGDPHPILGSNGVNWYTPIVLMQRAKNAPETLAGIPDVLLIGSVRPTVVGGVSQGFVARETFSAADVIVPPVGVVVTNPLEPVLCRVPYIPPGNSVALYDAQRSECQELPSGNYDVNVLAGVAGARVVDIYTDCIATCVAGGTTEAMCDPGCRLSAQLRSDTGVLYEGGQYSSQAWSVPNELGCPDLSYHPASLNQLDPRDAMGHFPSCGVNDVPAGGSVLLPSQSRHGSFAVVDPDGSNAPDMASQISSMPTEGRGAMGCDGIDRSAQMHVPTQCCTPIRHLCGLPLCPLRDASTMMGYPEGVRASGTSRMTREMRYEGMDFHTNPDGTVTPLCVPFMMPVDCCQPT